MRGRGTIHIGTSGWHYRHWKGPFYPPSLSSPHYLAFYAERFPTVEINNSFYRLPERKTLAAWRKTVPPHFVFAAKASRYITEAKKLKDPQDPLKCFFSRIDALGDTLGPILFQLPPYWRVNLERLKSFLAALPAGYRCAFEFREPSWFTEGVYEALAAHGIAFCLHDHGGVPSPEIVTADTVYVRFHGPQSYGDKALAPWAGRIGRWSSKGKDVYCYFNNDRAGYAVKNALRLIELMPSGRLAVAR